MTVTAKICGINDVRAMQAAAAGGATHVGMVFYPPSPRAVTPAVAADLAVHAGNARKVGLFVDPEDALIDAVLARVALDMLQLHGDETPDRVAALRRRTGLPVMKAIKVADVQDLAMAEAYLDSTDWLMFDAKAPADRRNALPGGNAVSFEWRLLAGRSFAGKSGPLPWMLAGGLNPANIAEAVRLSGARTVDTSSGVEDAPGRKNPDKIRDFLAAVAAL